MILEPEFLKRMDCLEGIGGTTTKIIRYDDLNTTCNEKYRLIEVESHLKLRKDMIKGNCREEQNKLFVMSIVGSTSDNKV